jgi:hypothetical protein
MQYYQHSRQTQSSKPEKEVRQVRPANAPQPEEWREHKKQMSELMKELRDQVELTLHMKELIGELKDRVSLPWKCETPPVEGKPTGCFKCGDQ